IIESQIEPTLERLRAGQRVAFVSDAGMPGISDPGQHLVDAALSEGLATEVIPGPSAVTCALVASGLASDHFFFEGFLPRKHGQIVQRLQQLAAIPGTIVLYESPFRVLATVEAIAEVFPTRQVALVRELTKLHEEVVRDVAPCLVKTLAAKENLKGECVLVIAAPTEEELASASSQAAGESQLSLEDAIEVGLASGIRKSALAKELAQKFGIARDEAYQAILAHEA
ncbi:MAG: rRNA small subunit methyltransferase 1, partial [Atopobium sp.]|nr:rRNA small subunit methyltransferase 1 [Atopobium sp.]